jgi:hypothetical protein
MSSTGIAMEVHYCMGKKVGVDFLKVENEKCKKCGMIEKKGGCCNDEHKFYKLNAEYKNASHNVFTQFFHADELIFQTKDFFHFDFLCNRLNIIRGEYPPDKNYPPIYIMNCVFRL